MAHGIWTKPRLARAGMVGLAHGIWTKPHLAREPDEFPISEQVVPLIGSHAVSSRAQPVGDVSMRVPNFGNWVLSHDSVTELERPARELGTFFLDFFSIFEPFLHVTGEQLVCNSLVLLFGGWSSCPLAPPKHPLRWAEPVTNPRGVSVF